MSAPAPRPSSQSALRSTLQTPPTSQQQQQQQLQQQHQSQQSSSVASLPTPVSRPSSASSPPIVNPYLHYEPLSIIGRGKYSEVSHARHRQTGECVAMKKVAIFEMDSDGRKECINEANILQVRREQRGGSSGHRGRQRKRSVDNSAVAPVACVACDTSSISSRVSLPH